MIPWLKKLLFSEQSFISYIRATLLILGYVAESGKLGLPPDWEWIGYALMGAAVFIRAGEPNVKTAVLLLFLLLPITVQAAPFLVCDPPPAGECRTHYEVALGGQTQDVPAPLHFDLADVAAGSHSVTLRSVCVDPVWGRLTSAPVPFDFVRPGVPGDPMGVGISAN